MRAIIQRVTRAQVEIKSRLFVQIRNGLLVYLAVAETDTDEDAQYIADKLVNLRIFADEDGKMNKSLSDIDASILLVSNFTLYGDCQKGRRPGFEAAAEPTKAKGLYEKVAELITQHGVKVAKGLFAAHMHVSSINDGPVTFLLDSA